MKHFIPLSAFHADDRENRLCNFAERGPEGQDYGAESVKGNSKFKAEMFQVARSLEKEKGITGSEKDNHLAFIQNDDSWTEAWNDEYTFTGAAAVDRITDAKTLLLSMAPNERKKYLIMYLQERMPDYSISGGGNPAFDAIEATDFEKLDPASTANLLKGVRKMLLMDVHMQNKDTSDLEEVLKDPSTGALTDADIKLIKDNGDSQLGEFYENTTKAYPDFEKMMKAHPDILQETAQDPAVLKDALRNDKTRFAAAVKAGVFDAESLQYMSETYFKKQADISNKVQESTERRQKLRDRMTNVDRRNTFEKVSDAFSDMSTGQKIFVTAIGAYLIKRWFLDGDKRAPYEKVIATGATLGAVFLAGKWLLKDTRASAVFDFPDDLLNKAMPARAKPDLQEKDLDIFARYFREEAGQDVNQEIEAMGYMSQIPLTAIAESFSFQKKEGGADILSGNLSFERDSEFINQINKIYDPTGTSRKVLSILKENNEGLGDGMAHVFYLIGAAERPLMHQKIKDARNATEHKKYDEIKDEGLRQQYEVIAREGLAIARSKNSGESLADVIGKYTEK